MGKIIVKDGVRYTEEVAKRLGITGGETRETPSAHVDDEVRVDGAPAAVAAVPTGAPGQVVSTTTAALEGTREEGVLPGSVGTTGAPAPTTTEGTVNDGAGSGDDTETATGDGGGSSDPAEKASKRSSGRARATQS